MKIDDKTSHNSPSLRFPEFTGEWEYFSINDVCSEFKSGKNIKADLISSNGNFPVYGGNGLRGYTSSYNHDGLYVLIGRQGALCGNVRSVFGKIYITEHAIAVAGNEKSDTNFLHYLFLKMNLGQYSDQSAQPGLAVNKLLKLKVLLPSISEQIKIAKLLSLLDERIAVQSRLIEDLKKLRCALEERMLGQCQGKQVRLRDILIERVEKSRINNQYEVLSSTVSGIYSQREYFNKEIASADNTGYKAIHRGDVVLSPQNLWMGNINYNDRFEIGIVSPSYKVFSIDEKFDKGYIAFLLKTRKALWAYSLVSEQGASIVRRNLNYESFLEISFVIPSLKEQQATARRLSAFKQKHTMEEAFLRSLLLQKEFMLKSLFI